MTNKKELCFVAVVITAIIALWFLPTGFENPELLKNNIYEKAVVLSVDNSDVENITVVSIGTQRLELEIRSGKFKGEVVKSRNVLLGNKQRDKIFEVGDRVLAIAKVDNDHTKIFDARAEDYYRQDLALVLVIAFAICLIIFAGKTGAKAGVSFVFTALAFWKLLIPALLKGYSPLFVSIGVVFITTLVIILLVGGISRKGFVALSGAMLGVITTAGLALLFGYYFKIPGTVQNYAESLMYIGYANLNFSEMFISCIFISSAGAVMDVAMDIAAAQDELSANAPHLTTRNLIRSGLNIASPVVGSMTTTLLFAYSGSFMFAFMAFMAQGAPFESIINRGYISAEILHTMVGSFGLVLVAPITAVIGGYIYKFNHKATI
ncbi:MAG: YibE/F family protein [Rikenellaceae bacterium]